MIVLDTHALIWVVQDDHRLGPEARAAIESASENDLVRIPAIVFWELAMLAAKARVALNGDVASWLENVLNLPGVRLEPLHPNIAIDSTRLPGPPHGDPADRMIIATARHLSGTLVTADRKILSYAQAGHVRAINAST